VYKDGVMSKKWNMKTTIDIYKKSDGVCWYCGKKIEADFTIDHVIPISRGGTDTLENLVPCCKSCNSGKRNKSIEEFRRFYQNKMGMIFTKAQTAWLENKGITIPAPDNYYFWFERQ